jgi:hypothetical protein
MKRTCSNISRGQRIFLSDLLSASVWRIPNDNFPDSRFLYVDEHATGQETENLRNAYPGLDEPLH